MFLRGPTLRVVKALAEASYRMNLSDLQQATGIKSRLLTRFILKRLHSNRYIVIHRPRTLMAADRYSLTPDGHRLLRSANGH
ncbi:MAG TPA: hypothetical protein VHD84_03615 [Candidatus Saccharimonadales bacterium]|nr:hypothetical protein [Candidatus Saccharimonadales bacterium]